MQQDDPTRLSGIEFLILKMLMNHGSQMYGLEMVNLSNRRLKRGTIYVTLGRMQDKGYIESEKEKVQPGARGLPRRLYKPTAEGMRVLAEWEMPANAEFAGGGGI